MLRQIWKPFAPYASVAVFLAALAGLVALSCGREQPARTLSIGAYTAAREAYAELLPAFAREWRAKTGEELRFEESYLGSGAQARAIVGGFEADVAALALPLDIDTIKAAGLARDGEPGVVSTSSVVIGVRPGNPKNIRSFADLARTDVDVLTPDVKMSGGAMWNVAALLGSVDGDREAFLASVLARVTVFDKGARESMLTFESGAGDAVLTYESEIFEAKRAGQAIEEVAPAKTVLIENPAIVVDVNATKHRNLDVANAFVAFLTTSQAQQVFARHGYNAPPSAAPSAGAKAARTFTVDELGGWQKLEQDVFKAGALYDHALSKAKP